MNSMNEIYNRPLKEAIRESMPLLSGSILPIGQRSYFPFTNDCNIIQKVIELKSQLQWTKTIPRNACRNFRQDSAFRAHDPCLSNFRQSRRTNEQSTKHSNSPDAKISIFSFECIRDSMVSEIDLSMRHQTNTRFSTVQNK